MAAATYSLDSLKFRRTSTWLFHKAKARSNIVNVEMHSWWWYVALPMSLSLCLRVCGVRLYMLGTAQNVLCLVMYYTLKNGSLQSKRLNE